MKDSQQQRKQQKIGSDRVDTLTNPTQGSSKVHTVARTSSNGEKKKIEDKKQMQREGGEGEDGAAAVLSIVKTLDFRNCSIYTFNNFGEQT